MDTDTKPASAATLRALAGSIDGEWGVGDGSHEGARALHALADTLESFTREDVAWVRDALVHEVRDGDRYEQSAESASRQEAIAAKLSRLLDA